MASVLVGVYKPAGALIVHFPRQPSDEHRLQNLLKHRCKALGGQPLLGNGSHVCILFSILSLKPAYLPSWVPFYLFICTVILTLPGAAIFSKVLLKDMFEKYFGPNSTQVRRKRDHDFAEL